MRVATWNLDHASNGSRPIDLQIQQILSVAPDILILTETCDEVDLAPFGYFSLCTEKNYYQKYCSVIWSKFPILTAIRTYDPETSACAVIDTPLGNLLVYGTIITYFGDKGPNRHSPYWYEHHKAIRDHGEDWERIISAQVVRRGLVWTLTFSLTGPALSPSPRCRPCFGIR